MPRSIIGTGIFKTYVLLFGQEVMIFGSIIPNPIPVFPTACRNPETVQLFGVSNNNVNRDRLPERYRRERVRPQGEGVGKSAAGRESIAVRVCRSTAPPRSEPVRSSRGASRRARDGVGGDPDPRQTALAASGWFSKPGGTGLRSSPAAAESTGSVGRRPCERKMLIRVAGPGSPVTGVSLRYGNFLYGRNFPS
jgi:hypothetical protein